MVINELRLGRSVLVDCVALLARVNDFWSDLLSEEIRYIECICSNNQLHESRISSRVRCIPGWYELTRNDISNIKGQYQPFSKCRLVVGASDNIDKNIAKAVEYACS